MPAVLSQPGLLGPYGNAMAPPPAHYPGHPMNGEQWPKEQQVRRGPMNGAPSQGWEDPTQSWQGQLGPNLMPMTGTAETHAMAGAPSQTASSFAGGSMPNGMAMHSPHSFQDFPRTGMQNMVGQLVPGRPVDVPRMQLPPPMQHAPQVSNMHNPMMQVIALPAGAAPPEGAIPVGQWPVGTPPTKEALAPQMSAAAIPAGMQMIAVPMGEAPPEGAIPVEHFSPVLGPWNPEPAEPTPRIKKAFKIKDPSTGRELFGAADDGGAAPRRKTFTIKDPRTGMEVRPNL